MMETPEFKEWQRKKEDMRRWKFFGYLRHLVGVLVLGGLAVYAAHLNGMVEIPGADKFSF